MNCFDCDRFICSFFAQIKAATFLPENPPNGVSEKNSGSLYSIQVRFNLPPVVNPKGEAQDLQSPFAGGELVGLRSPRWKESLVVPLGVVRSWDPVCDKKSKNSHVNNAIIIKVLVCVSSTGGDGEGGQGGWFPLPNIQKCVRKPKGSAGIPVSFVSVGSIMTASREFQAVMSLSDLPTHVQRCLVDPSVSKINSKSDSSSIEIKLNTTLRPSSTKYSCGALSLPSSSSSIQSIKAVASGINCGPLNTTTGTEDNHQLTNEADGEDGLGDGWNEPSPANVPEKMWNSLLASFNRSQVKAIRKVAEGSPAGFTLLQVNK